MKAILTDADTARLKYNEAKTLRSPFEPLWTEAAKHVLPSSYQGMQTTGSPHQGLTGYGQQSTRMLSHDSTGRRMLPRFVSVLDRLLTPRGQRWHRLRTSEPALNKSRRVQEFYEELTHTLFAERYKPQARFVTSYSEAYSSIGCFGNAALTIRARRRSPVYRPGLVYRTYPLRSIFWLVNADGDRDVVFAQRWLNARQIKEEFREYYEKGSFPEVVTAELGKHGGPSESRFFEVVEFVCVNYDSYDPEALDVRRMPWQGRTFMPEARAYLNDTQGYVSNPFILPRYFTEAGDLYGTSPAIASIASMGGASAMKRHMLKVAEKRADPAWLTHDPGILIDTRPNGITGGGLDQEGRPLVRRMDEVSGTDIRGVQEMLADERSDIEDTFLGRLFSILEETREMTAREVAERVSKEFALVAPTMGRLQEELTDPTVTREVDVLVNDPVLSERLPEVPPELVEAEGEYEVEMTSPMARAERMEDVQGFAQAVEIALNIATNAQQPQVLDTFNFDEAVPDIAGILNVPVKWLTPPEELEQKRQDQQTQAGIEQAIQAAPAIAGLAQATQ